MKTVIKYKVIALPSTTKLSPQLLSLVTTLDFLKEEINGDMIVDRDKVYKCWLDEIAMEDNEKVFASYIHQLIQFAFIERLDVKPKKTVEERKQMLMKQLSLMSKEDKAEMLASLED